jgi:hypothetical protein
MSTSSARAEPFRGVRAKAILIGDWNTAPCRPYNAAMDPNFAKAISEVLGPFLGVLACGAIPVTLVFLTKHFKLRTRELELEAELHGRDAQARIQALETRLGAMEGAMGSLVNTLSRRQDLLQPPDAPQIAQEAARLPSLSQVK